MVNTETDATEMINKMLAKTKQTIDEKQKKLFLEKYIVYYKDYSSDLPKHETGMKPEKIFEVVKQDVARQKVQYLETDNGLQIIGILAGMSFGTLNRKPGKITVFSGTSTGIFRDVLYALQTLTLLMGKPIVLRRISHSRIFTHQKEYSLDDIKLLTNILETI